MELTILSLNVDFELTILNLNQSFLFRTQYYVFQQLVLFLKSLNSEFQLRTKILNSKVII